MNKNITITITAAVFILAIIIVFALQSGRTRNTNVSNKDGTTASTQSGGFFSTTAAKAAEARASQIVALKDGDTFDMTASIVKKEINGKEVKMLAYNGMIPGPLMKVPQGATITVNFTNNTDVETTIHSHGVRLANKFDGVPDVTQKPIGIGEKFTYRLTFPDVGLYWYHPHIREDYAQELGLYGNFLVTPSEDSYWSPVNREVPLILDDILIGPDGIEPFHKQLSNRTLMGRYGNVMLVNGETSYALQAQPGEVVRFYITNAANARPFNLAIPGATMKLVGGDNGRYEQERIVESALLNPSERAIVEVFFEKSGTFRLEHQTPDKTYLLGTIIVSGATINPSYIDQFQIHRENKELQNEVLVLGSKIDGQVDKRLRLGLSMQGMGMMQQQAGGHDMHMMGSGAVMQNDIMTADQIQKIEWEDDMGMMNTMSNSEMVKWQLIDEGTDKVNEDIDWKFQVGDMVKISIFNDPKSQHPMQHPIHFHGQRFLLLSTNGVKNDDMVWKDSVLVQTGDTIEILLQVTNPGEWMAHCHIAEHLESGMMFQYSVSQ